MMRYTTLRYRPRQFQSFTGLTVKEFDRLVSTIQGDWVIQRIERLEANNPHPKRSFGGGRTYRLSTLEDQLLLTLVWLRLYPVYLVLEYLFGIDESTVSRLLKVIQPLLKDRFILPERLPKRKIRTIEELREFLPDVNLDEILTDATEQEIPRPQDKRRRKRYHSGKQQAFTMKTQLATNRYGIPVHVSPSVGGRMHDYKLFKQSRLPQVIPKDCRAYFDNGYQGVQKDYPFIAAVLPFKRHRGKPELSLSEKRFNKCQRRIRIRVENGIAQLKTFNVLKQPYRHSLHNYNQTFRAVASIVSFRLRQRLLPSIAS